MTHPAESIHWYDPKNCTPVYEVPNAKGDRMIRPDVRHARKMGLVPGVTGIIRCAHSHGLERWKIKQAAMAALTLPRIDGETDETFIDRILTDAAQEAANAADEGTRIHAAIQEYYTTGEILGEYSQTVLSVHWLLDQMNPNARWVPERTCTHILGYGTKADLSHWAWVIDFKTKEFGPEDIQKLSTYTDHHMQLAATREALTDTYGSDYAGARCAIVYVSRTHPGLVHPVDVTEGQLSRGWEMFKALHRFWCLDRNYEPAEAFQA